MAELSNSERGSRFVSEIVRSIARRNQTAERDAIETALQSLEAEGRLLVRDHFCADPHLEGVDLRIAGIVPPADEGRDQVSACIENIESRWQEWIKDYLAEHRCT